MRKAWILYLLTAMFAQPVKAAVITITLTGSVAQASEFVGVFANVPVDLSDFIGTPFSEVFSFDTSNPDATLLASPNYFAPCCLSGLDASFASVSIGSSFQASMGQNLGSVPERASTSAWVSDVGETIPLIGNHTIDISAIMNSGQVKFEDQEEIYEIDATFNTMAISSSVSSVPEPSTWTMLILGFVGIGAMKYRRRRMAAC